MRSCATGKAHHENDHPARTGASERASERREAASEASEWLLRTSRVNYRLIELQEWPRSTDNMTTSSALKLSKSTIPIFRTRGEQSSGKLLGACSGLDWRDDGTCVVSFFAPHPKVPRTGSPQFAHGLLRTLWAPNSNTGRSHLALLTETCGMQEASLSPLELRQMSLERSG